MKHLTALLLLLSFSAQAGLPPTTIKGQSDPSPVTTFNLQAPHSQITRLGGVNALIETGNANTLVNPNANGGTAGYSASGGTFTTGGAGNATYFSFDSGSAGEIVSSGYQTVASGDQWSGQNGVISAKFKCAAGTCTHKLQVYDGTTVLAEGAITSTVGTFSRTSVNFIYPASGTVRWQLVSVAADEPAVQWLGGYRGLAEGFNLSQAAGAIETAWTPSTHIVPTNLGTITNNQLMERRMGPNLEVSGSFQMGTGTVGQPALFMLSGLSIDPVVAGTIDGNKVGDLFMSASSTLALYGPGVPQAIIFYDGSSTDRLFVAGSTYSNNSRIFTQIDANGLQPSTSSKVTLKLSIPISGWATQVNGLNVISDQAASSWTGYHTANCTWSTNSTSYADPADAGGGCALVERDNQSFGTVTTTGGTKPGVTFTPHKTGRFMVIASTMLSEGTGPAQAASAQMIDQSGHVLSTGNSYQASSAPTQVPLHGVVNVTSLASPTTVKIQLASSSGAQNAYMGNGSTSAIEWTIFQLDGAQALPYFTGSVTSIGGGQTRTETLSAPMCTTGTCAITWQSGGFTSLTRTGTGTYQLDYPAFPLTPGCHVDGEMAVIDIATPTTLNFRTFNTTGTITDWSYISVTCSGPR